MPRFTDVERETINKALLEEGQRLFDVHGLKKVTVDDLTAAANISKGSFYAFFQSKEHLFAVINFKLQEQLYAEMKQYLDENKLLSPKELATGLFRQFFKRAMEYPIFPKTDVATISHLQRKLPTNIFEEHTLDDKAFVNMLSNYGITFKQDTLLITKSLQALYGCACTIVNDNDFDAVMNVLIEGIVNQVN